MKPSILLFVSLCCAFSLFGQNQEITNTSRERLFIGKITVEGAENYDRNAVKVIAGLHEGMVIHIPGDEISEAIQNLWNEKLFADVHISIKSRKDDMVHLLIELVSLPKLSRFSFEGISRREANKLREEIKLFSGKTITKDLVFTTESKIRSYYKKKGFHATEVRIEQSDDPVMDNSKIFTIIINKKKRVKIGEINFEDVESIKPRRLKMAMRNTKQNSKLWRFYQTIEVH
jgi:outer membrane protein insertion porin family